MLIVSFLSILIFVRLAFSSHPWSSLLCWFANLLLLLFHFSRCLGGGARLLYSLGRLLGFLCCADGLVSLSLTNLWLHVPLGLDFGQRRTHNGPLELVSPSRPPLLLFLLNPLLVLPPVVDGPGDLPGIPLHEVRPLALGVEECEHLPVHLH